MFNYEDVWEHMDKKLRVVMENTLEEWQNGSRSGMSTQDHIIQFDIKIVRRDILQIL